jgi:membrane-bound metal-dependent hydrolase YbcI (DUF457 family)
MISLWIVLAIIVIHYIADYICQTHWMAINKSSNNYALLSHTLLYSLCWIILPWITINPMFLLFIPITFICHTITDYFTSRKVKYFFDKKDFHNGFVVIGFDQVLHYFQLFLTYYLIDKI